MLKIQEIPQNSVVLISINPKAGRSSTRIRAEQLKKYLSLMGFKVEIYTDLKQVSERANRLFVARKLHVLVGVGGDGTVAELTNRTLLGVPITLLPSGTANLVAKYLELPTSPQKTAEMILDGINLTLDAGIANGRLFLVMASAGIDANVVNLVHTTRERGYITQSKRGAHISFLSYLLPILKSIRSYKYSTIKTEFFTSGSEKNSEINLGNWSFIFNLPQYGWGLSLVPDCLGNDQKLDYCIFQGNNFFTFFFDIVCAQCGSLHRFLPNVMLGQATNFILSSSESNNDSEFHIPYQLDGDPGGFLPVEISTVPNRFTVLIPKNVAKKIFKETDNLTKKLSENIFS